MVQVVPMVQVVAALALPWVLVLQVVPIVQVVCWCRWCSGASGLPMAQAQVVQVPVVRADSAVVQVVCQ